MISGWSFCIVTAPGNESLLAACINKIRLEFISQENYEIIVIGNTMIKDDQDPDIKYLDFKEEVFSFRFSNFRRFLKEKSIRRLLFRTGAICHKKNLGANHAKYDRLCMMHDYVGIEAGWMKGFDGFGLEWDVSMNIILNKDGSRYRDWTVWDYPLLSNKKTKACLLPYNRYTQYMYISGTYFCVKRDFFLKNQLDEKLFWGDDEDVEWSLRVRTKTKFKMNINSKVKFLKLKPLNGAPYSSNWVENENELLRLLGE